MIGVSLKLDESELAAEVEMLFRVAYRLTGNADDAEDLVQDVCERALTRAPEFAATDDCRRWLLRVLYNRFIDGQRQQQRSPLVAVTLGAEHASSDNVPDPEALAVRSDSESALERAWTRLEPAQQVLLLLRAEGHALDEIARITDIDKPALSARLYRARASLAKYLDEERCPPPLRVIRRNDYEMS